MAKRTDYADNLREALLALALIPVAGLQTVNYWLNESIERTVTLATDVIASTALARAALHITRSEVDLASDPVADVLAQDLLDAGRLYVRGMVRLPADSAIYFTGELERHLNELLRRIQPDAATDLESYVGGELDRLLLELDRLSVTARAEEGRAEARPTAVADSKTRPHEIGDKIAGLRNEMKAVRDRLDQQRSHAAPVQAREDTRLRTLDLQKARTRLRQALDSSEALLQGDTEALAKVRALIDYLNSEPSTHNPTKEARQNGH